MNTKTIVVTAILGIAALGALVYAGNDARVQKSGGEKVEIKVEPNCNLIGVGKEEDDDD
jgi:hypothetical protein